MMLAHLTQNAMWLWCISLAYFWPFVCFNQTDKVGIFHAITSFALATRSQYRGYSHFRAHQNKTNDSHRTQMYYCSINLTEMQTNRTDYWHFVGNFHRFLELAATFYSWIVNRDKAIKIFVMLSLLLPTHIPHLVMAIKIKRLM